MRIYTEVNFQWDDKKGKLVELSSNSFDYQGELALCAGAWETKYFYDVAGNKYKREIKYYKNPKRAVYSRTTNMTTGVLIGEKSKDHLGMGEHRTYQNNKIKGESHNSKMYSSVEGNADWAAGYLATYHLQPSGDAALDIKWSNETQTEGFNVQAALASVEGNTVTEDYWTALEDEGLDDDDLDDDGLDDEGLINTYNEGTKEWYDWETANNPDFDSDKWKETTNPGLIEKGIQYELIGEPIPLGEGAEGTKTLIETIMTDWANIVDPTRPDAFQEVLEDAVQELGWAEEDIIDAYDTLQDKFVELEQDYTTDVSELTGERIVDPVTGEVISEGTYIEDIRLAEKIEEEGLKTTITTREGELEALREEAGGEIRAAEAKIGAAGFASTGVGQTARDVLAKEIGEAAEDIDIEFGEGRTLVKEAYTEETGRLTKEKNVSLTTYKETRDRAAKTAAEGDWKGQTEAYQRLLESYDALKGETGAYTLPGVTAPGFTAAGGVAAQAESELTGIQADIESMIYATRELEGYEDWDPFTAGATEMEDRTALYGLGSEYGWDPISKTFSPSYAEGLFDLTVAQETYTPTEALRLYDPTEVLGFEEEDGGV